MNNRTGKLFYLALIPAIALIAMAGIGESTVYRHLSDLLLTTASMEAAANGGAIGEHLPPP